jgi:hypothetical protein
MKKTLTFKIAIFALLAGLFVTKPAASQNPDNTGRRAQNVFVELGGPGLLVSANYDTRFANRRDGLGGRVGIGYLSVSDVSVTNVPIQLNYLLGKNGKYFEIGAGATYAHAKHDNGDDDFLDFNGSGTIGTLYFGYRYQPMDDGFHFRAGISPLFNSSNFLPYYAGIGFGYTF